LRLWGDEIDAAISVGALGGGEVEIGERNSPRPLLRKNPERLAEDGVILHFHLVAIAVNEESRRRLFFGPQGRFSGGSATRVPQSLVFTHQFNFRCQIADLRGELSVWLCFESWRGRLFGLVPRRGEPIGIDRLKAQRGASSIELPAV
jgi:hypothetical protein